MDLIPSKAPLKRTTLDSSRRNSFPCYRKNGTSAQSEEGKTKPEMDSAKEINAVIYICC